MTPNGPGVYQATDHDSELDELTDEEPHRTQPGRQSALNTHHAGEEEATSNILSRHVSTTPDPLDLLPRNPEELSQGIDGLSLDSDMENAPVHRRSDAARESSTTVQTTVKDKDSTRSAPSTPEDSNVNFAKYDRGQNLSPFAH